MPIDTKGWELQLDAICTNGSNAQLAPFAKSRLASAPPGKTGTVLPFIVQRDAAMQFWAVRGLELSSGTANNTVA
jgi:hypothetical protein